MKLNPLYLSTLLGILVAVVLWKSTTISPNNIIIDFPQKESSSEHYPIPKKREPVFHATVYYEDYHSALVRITPNACIHYLRVNKHEINPFPKKQPCDKHVVTRDISKFLVPGLNYIDIKLNLPPDHWQGWAIRSIHSGRTMMLIVFCIVVAPAMAFLRRVWREDKFLQWVKTHRNHCLAILVLTPLVVAARHFFINDYSNDYKVFIKAWFDNIQYYDFFEVLHYRFTNYAPLYTYLLTLADFFFPDAKILYLVKGVSMLADLLGAYWVYRIVALTTRDNPDSLRPLLSAYVILLTPTVIVNGSAVAQCDMWWVAFLLAAFYHLMVNQPKRCLVYGGLAVSFKFQAIFMAPFLLICVLKKIIPWRTLWVPPVVYVALCIPAWFEGRHLWGMLSIYWQQFNTYANLTETGNLYHFINKLSYDSMRDICLLFATLTTTSFVYLTWKRWQAVPTLLACLLLATFFSGLMPYILPKMINRYFLVADVFSMVLACVQPRWFMLALLFQVASLLNYQAWQFGEVERWTGFYMKERFDAGTFIVLAAIVTNGWLCWTYIWRDRPQPLPALLQSPKK